MGPDIARGWGKRRTVAHDFVYDSPVMLGSQRIGPDLANIGVRQTDANWHLRHLFAPAHEVKGSTMPPYRYLFERRRIQAKPSPEALSLPAAVRGGDEFEWVPRAEAHALVAYLLSLRANEPLFEAPMTVAAAPAASTGTNAPTTGTGGTNTPAVRAGATNTPAVGGATNTAGTNQPPK
jgi:cytochrome c oxidase cbb3-type subunit 2